MASKTLTINHAGGGSETYTVNRDKFAGVRQMSVDGQSVEVDHTAVPKEQSRETTFGGTQSITIKRDIEPLLTNVVGGASAAYSLRDLNDKAGNSKVVKVRRSGDQAEKTFTAKEVPQIADWVNGKQDTTLPCDMPPNPEDINGFTVSGTDASFNSTFTLFGGQLNGKNQYVHSSASTRKIRYRVDGKWELDEDGDKYQVSVDVGKDYPWEVEDWVQGPEGSSGGPVFSNFAGGNIDNTPAAAYSLRKVKSDYTGNAVKIRRTSDNIEVNVAFDSNGEVSDSSAITNLNPSNYPEGITSFTVTGANSSDGEADGTYVLNTSNNRWYNGGSYFYRSGNSWRQFDDVEVEGVYLFGTTDGEYPWQVTYSGADNPITSSNFSDFVGPDTGDTTATTLGEFISGTDATVVSWFDQSGNGNHATQDVAGSQPLIAQNGSLLDDGIDFDSGVSLPLSGDGLDIFKDVGYGQIFSVIKSRVTGTGLGRYFEADVGVGSGARFLLGDGQDDAGTFRIGGRTLDGDSFGDEESPTSHNNDLSLITGFLNYTDAEGFLFLNGTQVATNSIPNMTAGNTSNASSNSAAIGATTVGNTAPFNAKELIIYDSDQSANRFKIESNINNHYGIYTAAEDGFVETWFDQSGNGNDATQSTLASQPKIVDGGGLLDELSFDGVDDKLDISSLTTLSNPFTMFQVVDLDNVNTSPHPFRPAIDGITSDPEARVLTGNVGLSSGDGFGAGVDLFAASIETDIAIRSYFFRGDATSEYVRNGVSVKTGNCGSRIPSYGLRIGAARNTTPYASEIRFKEFVIYDSDQSANRPAIEKNINNYYEIF